MAKRSSTEHKTEAKSTTEDQRGPEIEQYFPKDFNEHFSVKKPIGVRVHKGDCRITHVLAESFLNGKVFVGDTILAVDDKTITNGDTLQQHLQENSEKVKLYIRHNMWSWCFHIRTTVEKINIDREVEKCTSNPVNHYLVLIRMKKIPEIPYANFGLMVQYNNRDRLEVSSVAPNSLSAIHLRPGDVIRECNGQALCSKSMLRFLINTHILKDGQFTLLIEAPISDGGQHHVEISDDVIQIADKQVALMKSSQVPISAKGALATSKKSPSKQSTTRASVAKSKATEHPIVSDMDPAKLKPCKNAN